jgi:hypothetical protein
LIRSAWKHIDAAAGGSFFALSIKEARKLVEKMVCNQTWDEECYTIKCNTEECH